MTLKETSARLSTVGTPTSIQLIHKPTGEILQELLLRQATEPQRNFIISTWLKSYRPVARRLGFQTQYDKHEPAIAEGRWQDCTVATDEDGYTAYAWVCGYVGHLYHCYVIPELRGVGVAASLIEAACGANPDYARPWPYRHHRVNPYLLGTRHVQD